MKQYITDEEPPTSYRTLPMDATVGPLTALCRHDLRLPTIGITNVHYRRRQRASENVVEWRTSERGDVRVEEREREEQE